MVCTCVCVCVCVDEQASSLCCWHQSNGMRHDTYVAVILLFAFGCCHAYEHRTTYKQRPMLLLCKTSVSVVRSAGTSLILLLAGPRGIYLMPVCVYRYPTLQG